MGIYAKIKDLCREHDMSILQLEAECGLSNGAIRRWDASAPNVFAVAMVAEYFNVAIEYIIGDAADRNVPRNRVLKAVEHQIVGLSNCARMIEKYAEYGVTVTLEDYYAYRDGIKEIPDSLFSASRKIAEDAELPLAQLGFPMMDEDTSVDEIVEKLHKDADTRLLLSRTDKMTKEDVKQLLKIQETFIPPEG